MKAQVTHVLKKLEARSLEEKKVIEALKARGVEHVRAEAKGLMLDIGPDAGKVVNTLVHMLNAKRIVEVGASVGYSTLWLAEAAEMTGGIVISLEIDADKQKEQCDNLSEAGLMGSVKPVLGDAFEILKTLEDDVDLALIDFWPRSAYITVFELLWPRIRRGGVIVADNMLKPESSVPDARAYLEYVESRSDARTFVVPTGSGLGLTVKV